MAPADADERSGIVLPFLDRLGGMIVTPRQTLEVHCTSHRGGFNDFLLLLFTLAVGLQMPALGRAGWTLLDIDVLSGAMVMLRVLSQLMLVPLGAVVIGGVLLKALTASGRAVRHLDVVALCALPALALQLATSLLALAVRQLYQPIWRYVVLGASALWFLALLALAVKTLRARIRSARS
ncbi:MAG: hypothetical protein CSA65_07130 [Proteobacteria bacterium]|nr:MAG: hypothetical protein CSB49_06555 [Pseudomonadota bacterium]PIE17920.1 MAG: hypothetical protein CSA65_07130 [Pseudomonadota bacterium]